jgi:hypothetical protein
LIANWRIDAEAPYSPPIHWANLHWQKQGQSLHLALDTTMTWNLCCVVVVSAVSHGKAMADSKSQQVIG